jgi:hypothetical protein
MSELERTLEEIHRAMWRCELDDAEEALQEASAESAHPLIVQSQAEVCCLSIAV